MEEQIKKELETLIVEQFNINLDQVSATNNLYLLGMLPRDVVKLVLLVEDEFDIHFSEIELVENKFDTISGISFIISQHMSK